MHSSSPTSSRREVLRRSSRACARLLSFPREAIALSRRIGRSSLCPAIKPAVKKKKGGKRGGKRREKGRKIERVHLLARTVKTAVLQAPAYRGRSSRCFPFAAPLPSPRVIATRVWRDARGASILSPSFSLVSLPFFPLSPCSVQAPTHPDSPSSPPPPPLTPPPPPLLAFFPIRRGRAIRRERFLRLRVADGEKVKFCCNKSR